MHLPQWKNALSTMTIIASSGHAAAVHHRAPDVVIPNNHGPTGDAVCFRTLRSPPPAISCRG